MREAIYKGATRPAIVLGVPLLPALVLTGAGSVIGAWGALLVSGWALVASALVVLPVLAWMRMVTRSDDQRVRQHVKRLQLTLRNLNRRTWKCRSYSPIRFTGTRDGWLR